MQQSQQTQAKPQQQSILSPFNLWEQSELTGTVERTVFHNANNGYSVLSIRLSGQKDEFGDPVTFTAVGNMPSVRTGDEYTFHGKFQENKKYPQYGKQFAFTNFEMQLPTTRQGIVAYLSDVAYGVGTIKAKKLVAELEAKYPGRNTLELIQENPAVLQECKTINKAQAEEINNHLAQNGILAELTSLICREGVTPGLAGRIYAQYGAESVKIVKENPYLLADELYNVGFKRADVIAQAVGIPKDSEYRIKAAITYIIKEAQSNGHCYLEPKHIVYGLREGKQTVIMGLKDLLGFLPDIPTVAMANEKLIDESRCVREGDAVYDYKLHEAECGVAAHMLRLAGQEIKRIEEPSLDQLVADTEKMLREQQPYFSEYAPEQREAVKSILVNGISVVTGPPGTGKTTVLNGVIKAYKKLYPYQPIYLCAPTGRAAKRMTETTGLEAKTIHRLLRYNPEIGGFIHNENNQLKGPGLLLCDEASMNDCELSYDLLQSIENGIQAVLIGDVAQLPSVGPGSILRDSIDSGVIPTVRLQYNYRQAAGSGIADYAHMICRGEWQPPTSKDIHWVRISDELPAAAASEQAAQEVVKRVVQAVKDGLGVMDFQVLSPQRKGAAGVNNLNELIQNAINPKAPNKPELTVGKSIYRLGSKVMVTSNNYELGVFNGDLGLITGVMGRDFRGQNKDGKEIKGPGIFAEFDGEEVYFDMDAIGILDLAYASTIHKCVALDTLIETDDGLIRIKDADSGYVASINGVRKFIRTAILPEKEMLCITTEDGYRVTVTPDHGLDSWDGEKYRRFEAQELKIGDWLQVGLGARIETLLAPKMPIPTNGDVREKTFNVPLEMTAELAEFIGLMVADGTKFKGGFRLAKNHKEVVDRFTELCVSQFGYEPKRWFENGAYFAEVSSTYLNRWLTSIGGMEPNQKAVPIYILSGTTDHHRAFLRGLFEDAGVNLRTHNNKMVDHIDFTTCREQIASDVQIMLSRLGIVSNHVRNVGTHKHSKIYVYGEYARMFGKKVGFITKEKQRRSMLAAGKQTRYVMPISKNEAKFLYDINIPHMSKSDRGNFINRGHISKNKYCQLLNIPEWLKSRCANHHTRIVSIEKAISKSTCLHVPDGNKFLQNAISGWNCQGSEFKLVIMVCVRSHWIMMARNLVYTGETRARKDLVLIAQDSALKHAVENDKIADRFSLLKERLRKEI